jgi:SAM-dependent methyltransferase
MQTLELARLLQSRVVAIDNHGPFLAELKERAIREGLGDLVEPRIGDMRNLQLEAESVDLLWSEGAIYIIGFEQGLSTWRTMIRPEGVIAVTEAAWLRSGAPEELCRFWKDAYPAMVSQEENLRKAEGCGYRVLQHFSLPSEVWWANYYAPLGDRLAEFRARYSDDEEALAVLDEEAREIDLFRKYHEYYGYVFYVLKREG